MEYAHIVTENMIFVVELGTGNEVKIFKDSPQFQYALELVHDKDFEYIFDLDIKNIVTTFFGVDESKSVSLELENGNAYLTLHLFDDLKVKLEDALTNKIIKMHEQDFNCQSIINFIGNLYKNPSANAIKELYGFIEASNLPITEDGYFIAYKIVRHDYTDIYTGKMSNALGTFLEMPRGLVDDNKDNTCSTGLHFCSKEYLTHYGSSSRNTDRCILVKINPRDVVSIPVDYHNAKGRASTYCVVGEIDEGWRKTFHNKDYTDKAVVDKSGKDSFVRLKEIIKIVEESDFWFEVDRAYWWSYEDYRDGSMVNSCIVCDVLDLTYLDIEMYEQWKKA